MDESLSVRWSPTSSVAVKAVIGMLGGTTASMTIEGRLIGDCPAVVGMYDPLGAGAAATDAYVLVGAGPALVAFVLRGVGLAVAEDLLTGFVGVGFTADLLVGAGGVAATAAYVLTGACGAAVVVAGDGSCDGPVVSSVCPCASSRS